MRTKFIYLAVVILAAVATVSCSKDEKRPPLLSYFQVNYGSKHSLMWSAVNTLTPPSNGSYDIAMTIGKPVDKDGRPQNIGNLTDVFTFSVPVEDIGKAIPLSPSATIDPNSPKWTVKIKFNGQYYETGEDILPEDATITGGILEVRRAGTQNKFTINFNFSLNNGDVISGRHEGPLPESSNVYLNN